MQALGCPESRSKSAQPKAFPAGGPPRATSELRVVINVTGWSQGRINRLMDAIQAVGADVDTTPVAEVEVTGWTKALVEKLLAVSLRKTRSIQKLRRPC